MEGGIWSEVLIWGSLGGLLLAVIIHYVFSSQAVKIGNDTPPEAEESERHKKAPAAPVKKGAGVQKHKIPDKAHHHPLDLNTLKGHGDAVTGIAFTADGRGLATACADRVVRVFKLEDAASKSFKFLRINLPTGVCPTDVAFGEGHSQLAVAGVDPQGGYLCTFSATGGRAGAEAKEAGKLLPPQVKWERPRAHDGRSILTLAGAPATHAAGGGEGKVLLATCSEGTDVKLWAVEDGRSVGAVDSNQLKNTMAALSPDARFLAVAAFTADVKIWEVVYEKSGAVKEVARVMQLKGHKSAVTWLAFTADCQHIVTASKDGTVKTWNINVRYHLDEDPKCERTFSIPALPAAAAAPTAGKGKDKGGVAPHFDRIAVSPDGAVLAASLGPQLMWLSLELGAVLATAEHAHEGDITCMEWSPKPVQTDAGLLVILATGSTDKKVKLWLPPSH